MNNKEELTPELEKLISKVKLKEPPQELMRDYLSGVNAKIDRGIKGSHFGFPQFAIFLVISAVLAGFFYFFLVRLQRQPVLEVKPAFIQRSVTGQGTEAPTSVVSETQHHGTVSAQKPLTIEEEVTVLEAFGDEFLNESSDVFGDDEALNELAVLDEVELSPGLANQPPHI